MISSRWSSQRSALATSVISDLGGVGVASDRANPHAAQRVRRAVAVGPGGVRAHGAGGQGVGAHPLSAVGGGAQHARQADRRDRRLSGSGPRRHNLLELAPAESVQLEVLAAAETVLRAGLVSVDNEEVFAVDGVVGDDASAILQDGGGRIAGHGLEGAEGDADQRRRQENRPDVRAGLDHGDRGLFLLGLTHHIRKVEVVVDAVRSAKSRAVGSSTRLGSKQPSCS